jgi:hypothetical protein
VLKVVFVQVTLPLEGGQLALAATTYRRPVAEFTQAEIVWALAFCGPTNSRPMTAKTARVNTKLRFMIGSLRATECAHDVENRPERKKFRSGEELMLRALPPFALTELRGSVPRQSAHVRTLLCGVERVKIGRAPSVVVYGEDTGGAIIPASHQGGLAGASHDCAP